MQRLNVRQTQIIECIEKSMFAVDLLPRFSQGEILLLQLVKQDAISIGKLHSRVEFALIYDHYEVDHTGEISRRHWPSAGKTWKYILFWFHKRALLDVSATRAKKEVLATSFGKPSTFLEKS